MKRQRRELPAPAPAFDVRPAFGLLHVATGERGYQIHRRHRDPGTHPVARRRFFALTVPRRHAHELEFAVRTERSRA